MTTTQRITLNMYLAVRNFGLKNESIIQKVTRFLSGYTALTEKITEIQLTSQTQGEDKTGLTSDKNNLKRRLVTIAVKNSSKIAILAKTTKNNTLLNEINMKETELRRMPDAELKEKVQTVYDRVQANIESLVDQNVTPETQKLFLEMIEAYNRALATPRTSIAERKEATQRLSELFAAADEAIDVMDLAAKSVRDEMPEFYKGYRNARVKVDISSGTIWLTATARELISGFPVAGALFTFSNEELINPGFNGNGHITRKTTRNGSFIMKSLQPGTYKVTVSKRGYRNREVSVIVNEKEKVALNVELEKI